MAILNNNPLVGASGNQGGYNINNSLRFRSSASAYLNRTPASAGNRKTWTWSAWVKKAPIQGSANTLATLMGCTTGSTDSTYLRFGFYQDKFIVGNNSAFFLQSTPLYRDPSAWYHVVVSTDTTQGSASNRMRIYINGTEVTAWSTDQRSTYLTSSVDLAFNQASQHSIGSSLPNAGDYLDGYLADVNFIDGSAKTPSDFGETDTTTGVWKPKAYSGTYGTNGFYLKFSDIATTSGSNAGLGKDFSGNSNYWTTNNISVTSGTTYDAMTDSPTNTSATVANYCVLNPLDKNATGVAISSANLKNTTSSLNVGVRGTMSVSSGKWYWETTITTSTNTPQVGIATKDWGLNYVGSSNGVGYLANATKYVNGTATSYGATFTTGDIIGVALDMDGGSITFYKNNVSQGSAATGLSGEYFPAVAGQASDVTDTNFGQRPFSYTPPTGFVALNTFNLPTPTILQGNKYMDATLYTGNGTGQTITNAGSFRPDFLWIKVRSNTYDHTLADSVRGVSAFLASNTTAAEGTNSELTSFNSNGFTLGATGSMARNVSGQTYVGWQWQAGQGSTSSNTSGSITSTVSVNTTAGFSIVTYTGNSTTGATVGHGLGVTPSMIIIKSRSFGDTGWAVKHKNLSSGNNLRLNTTAAQGTLDGYGVIADLNSSTTFTLTSGGAGNTNVNNNTSTYVAYCFAEIAGFSRFGSYTGNSSSDGPFVYTGFRPKFILIKCSSNGGTGYAWFMYDTARNTFNTISDTLQANVSDATYTDTVISIDVLSNGFKVRGTAIGTNQNGGTMIYAAFAENPTKFALAR